MSQGVMWNALAAMPNPGAAFTQSFQAGMDRNKEQEKEWVQYLGNLAQWADTPEKWDQAVDHFSQQYPHAKQFKGRFELREPLMARAGIAPQKADKTELQRKADYYLSIGRPDLAKALLENEAHGRPQMVAFTDGGGVAQYDPATRRVSPVIMPNPGDAAPGSPVSAGGPPAEAVARLKSNPHEAAQFDEIFGPGASDRVLGGSGGNVGGGFRDPLAPL